MPIIGNQIQLHSLKGSVAALIVGLVTSLLAGMGVTNAAQNALDAVWAIPYKDRPDFLHSRLRGLGLLTFLGALFIVSTGASGLVSGGFGGIADKVVGYVIALIVNFALFFAAFRLMTAPAIPSRDLRIGVIVAGVAWTILQALGGYYIGHVLNKQSDAGKTFGLVIALLVWLHLGAMLLIYTAEINVVVTRRLWPRSLLGPPVAPADKRTLRALAKVEERPQGAARGRRVRDADQGPAGAAALATRARGRVPALGAARAHVNDCFRGGGTGRTRRVPVVADSEGNSTTIRLNPLAHAGTATARPLASRS